MKKLLIVLAITQLSCSPEYRIYSHSYTNEWKTEDGMRYQVYKKMFGQRYILKLNKSETKFKRSKYIQ